MVNRIFETVKHLYHPDTTKESAHMITFTKTTCRCRWTYCNFKLFRLSQGLSPEMPY